MKSQREQKTVEGSFAEELCGKLCVKVSVGGVWLGWGGRGLWQGQARLSTYFSSFVLDMMSSFQLTKIKAISPSVREPDSAIRF